MVASIDRPTKTDPRQVVGACVKTPGGYRAYVVGRDPKDSNKLLIEYESKGMGEDSYPMHLLSLVHEAPTGSPKVAEDLPWIFIANFLSPSAADEWLSYSQSQIEWRHNEIKMFGKQTLLPRLEAIVGDGDYSYSGLTLQAQPWTEKMQSLREVIQETSGFEFAIAIGNQYRNGSDHIGWHSDDSPEMGERPAIASLSLGATRKFQLRHKVTKEVYTFELTHGSLFVMHPGCQEEWHHRICKTSSDVGVRINWTFRPLASESKPEQIKATLPEFSVGDRVRPNWSAGTDKLGEVIEIRTKGKRKPQYWAVVKWLEGRTEAIGTTSQVRFDQLVKAESSAIATVEPEVIEAELMPSVAESEAQLAEYEAEIAQGQEERKRGEQRIWLAAAAIRSQQLWALPKDADGNQKYKNFEHYCLERWGWQKSNAHEVAGAGEVTRQLQDAGMAADELPDSVAQLRQLAKLPPEQRLEVVEEVQVKTGGKLTAEAIKEAVESRKQPPAAATSDHDYIPIPPRPVRIQPFGKQIEGQAIAANKRGMVRVVYGENQESCIPGDKVIWLDMPTCKPSITPEESQQDNSEPEEMPVVRLQIPQSKLAQIQKYLNGAIVQIGDQTYCLKASDLRLEGI